MDIQKLNDNIEELRDLAQNRDLHNHTNQSNRERIERIAEQLESAYRAESEAWGNAAKMREALDLCVRQMCEACRKAYPDGAECIRGCEALQKAKAALAEPPRNCDALTVDEQLARLDRFCAKTTCNKCALHIPESKGDCPELCALTFAQMPYEDGGEK